MSFATFQLQSMGVPYQARAQSIGDSGYVLYITADYNQQVILFFATLDAMDEFIVAAGNAVAAVRDDAERVAVGND